MSDKLPLDKYPTQLTDWKYKDRSLWYEGNLEILNMPLASIIGSRKVSKEGIARTRRIAKCLVEAGYCIVSGLAEGVDTIAHRQALEMNGQTIAVMGTAIDECYPKHNLSLKKEIAERGLILTQFAPGTRIGRSNFPIRNELMAALSEVTIVTEAGETSGTRHQVKSALKLGRKVGLLASVASNSFPWIVEARSFPNLFVIRTEDDLSFLSGSPDTIVGVPRAGETSVLPIFAQVEHETLPTSGRVKEKRFDPHLLTRKPRDSRDFSELIPVDYLKSSVG